MKIRLRVNVDDFCVRVCVANLCEGRGCCGAQGCRAGADGTGWTDRCNRSQRRARMWRTTGQRRRRSVRRSVLRVGIKQRRGITAVCGRNATGWNRRVLWVQWSSGSLSVKLKRGQRVNREWSCRWGLWSWCGSRSSGGGPRRGRVRVVRAAGRLRIAAVSLWVQQQLLHVLRRQLELHTHHVGTDSKVNVQRWAPRQEVVNLQGQTGKFHSSSPGAISLQHSYLKPQYTDNQENHEKFMDVSHEFLMWVNLNGFNDVTSDYRGIYHTEMSI